MLKFEIIEELKPKTEILKLVKDYTYTIKDGKTKHLLVLCMESFNKEYHTNYNLKAEIKGRNRDYHISEMDNYQKMKKSIEIIKRI